MHFDFSLCSLVSYFSTRFSLKATVYLKIEMIPLLGSGLINYNYASCYVCNSFLSFILGLSSGKGKNIIFLP